MPYTCPTGNHLLESDIMVIDDQLEAWEAKYKPIINHMNANAPWQSGDEGGIMYETYGPEFDYVRSVQPEYVWTWVDGDNGTYIVNGIHFVNRIGYFITTHPCLNEVVEVQVEEYAD